MAVVSRRWIGPQWAVLLASVSALVTALVLQVGQSSRADQPQSLTVREIQLGGARPDALYALTVWVKDPAQLQSNAVLVTVKRGGWN
jgi:hypothetical protein